MKGKGGIVEIKGKEEGVNLQEEEFGEMMKIERRGIDSIVQLKKMEVE